MENAFYQKHLTRTYDLKGSSRNRFAKPQPNSEVSRIGNRVLLDGNFLEFTKGHPVGVLAEDHQFILKAVQNDTAFLNSINIVDYSMIVGLSYRSDDGGDYGGDRTITSEDLEVCKSVGMIAGQSSPTIIEPGQYGKRFRDAIHRKIAPRFREKLSDLIKGLLSAKMISYSRSPWVSPIVVIVKKNGVDIRLCIDYRLFNSLTQLMVYPMPLINDLLEDLDKVLWYCSLDMASGFWV
ncbi:Hypothetical protein PHPALM_5782, partial [Phytophthora palmivora]